MSGKDNPDQGAQDPRKRRLAEELRANLARRKAQARSRRAGAADDRDEGISAARAKPSPTANEKG
ncbi:hypothetical protein [Nitratireductor basaltis]|uniref:Uncharacterized protein n=1 Tax=Nitratireductor basaltis TaxID=472175 RepID=A0A084UDP9_9HYPH|nr:hypothetical protein [Nitratireductor basaltis]KFB11085.1 hypothetical protein EL18_02128 [Nitratireductor basaltis]